MELNWSLKELYTSFESEDFKNDSNNLERLIEDINLWTKDVVKDKENLVEKLEQYINKFTHLKELASKLGMYINLSLSVNTKDESALKYSDILEKN